ncbi:MAG: glycosyltransferase [Marinilabiliaceae bacterium]|nr:glycosyltransferase [Marinilabiliaceae bacterium]
MNYFVISLDVITLSILTLLLSVGLFQLFYWAFFMFRVRSHKKDADAKQDIQAMPVSIIVCARNESENLKHLIPHLINQTYEADIQVIIVDDASTDDTQMVLANMHSRYPSLYYTSIPTDSRYSHGKKLALTVGIKAAKYEHMLFTDADCIPVSDKWVATMMEGYNVGPKRQMVIGYGKYAKHPGLLNLFIRFETFFNAVQYFGYARAFRPFMGVGRNLSYTKSLYESSSKFRSNYKILSGDDDMFISEVATRKNCVISFSEESQTLSEPKRTWYQWAVQKSRHMTTASHYRFTIKLLLCSEIITRQLFLWGSLFVLLFFESLQIRISVAVLIFLRWLLMHISLFIAASRMRESHLWLWTILADIFMPWVQLCAWVFGFSTKSSNRWK